MSDSVNTNADTYETTIGNTTFQIVPRYIGNKPFLDVIKTAIKRDIEAEVSVRSDELLD